MSNMPDIRASPDHATDAFSSALLSSCAFPSLRNSHGKSHCNVGLPSGNISSVSEVLSWRSSPFKSRDDGIDRGLLYIAMTRAEDMLVILHSGSSSYVEELYRSITRRAVCD
jgi:hypothetical protein